MLNVYTYVPAGKSQIMTHSSFFCVFHTRLNSLYIRLLLLTHLLPSSPIDSPAHIYSPIHPSYFEQFPFQETSFQSCNTSNPPRNPPVHVQKTVYLSPHSNSLPHNFKVKKETVTSNPIEAPYALSTSIRS